MRLAVQPFWVLAAALTVSGCLTPGDPAMTAGPPGVARPSLDIFYITNRAPIAREDGSPSYGATRSHALAYGSVAVSGHDAVEAIVAPPTKIGQFPATPYGLEKAPGGVRRMPNALAAHQRSVAEMQGEIQRRVAATRRKEIVVFVHGYNNSFDDAAKSAAQICNDLGPQDFICIALTWPAGGSKGILFGYNVDRESGEFAVGDIRKAVRIIAGTPGLQRLHFIAHSRGTDVLTSALQQLAIEAYVSQSSIGQKLKIGNIVLAAPDMDIDVAFAKMYGVPSDPDLPYGRSPKQSVVYNTGNLHLTVYSSPGDKALSLSKALFGSEMRLGLLDAHADPTEEQLAPQVGGIAEFVSVEDGGGFIGHSYFLSNSAVRADLVALIRDRKKPGEPGRPLVEVNHPFWFLPNRPQAAQ